MIKAITGSKLVKNLAVASMITAGALGAGALNAKTKTNVTNPNQTEVVSKAGAQALLATSQVNTPIISTKHNEKLDKEFFGWCSEEEKIKFKPMVNEMYDDVGTFATSIELQRSINMEAFKEALITYADYNRFVDKETLENEGNKILKWFEESFHPYVRNREANYITSTPNSAQNWAKCLDDTVESIDWLSREQKDGYKEACEAFKAKQTTTDPVQKWSDLITFKTYALDLLGLVTNMKILGIYNKDTINIAIVAEPEP